jgi:hypothetical protein
MEKKSANSPITTPTGSAYEATPAIDAVQLEEPVAGDAPDAQADETAATPSTKLTDLLRDCVHDELAAEASATRQ